VLLADPLDFISLESFFGEVELSYKFGARPLSVALPEALSVALPLVDSVGAAGRFKTDSESGAAGIDGFSEPDELLDELPLLEGAELFGANVLGGLPLEYVEPELADGAAGVEVIVCVVMV
jgi:hypothetical protein